MYGNGNILVALIVFVAAVAAAIGALLVWLVPMVWNWIKPFIHQLTA